MPELLAPAGNFEKMRMAFHYGADAVYLAGQAFGMRAAADNFTIEELQQAVAYAHQRKKRVYITVNVMPRGYEYTALHAYLSALRSVAPDALIVADLGVLELAKEVLPQVSLHISTQANIVSAAACRAYYNMGAKRVVLGRELTLNEIREIRKEVTPDLELEAFIHGSMCISYSGRCLLSSFFTGRDANRGACTQPCRWNYHISRCEITEEKRPEISLPLEEVNGETFVMSSKDTSMIEHISDLMESGIDSFKIEGRMKSAYYTAVVTNTYRMAIDAYASGDCSYHPAWGRELNSVSHRPYYTGYYYDSAGENPNTTSAKGYLQEKAYLAMVLSYDEKEKRALLVQKNKFSAGDAVEFLTPGHVGVPFTAGEMFDEEGMPITAVPHPQMRFYMKTPFPMAAGDIIRGKTEE